MADVIIPCLTVTGTQYDGVTKYWTGSTYQTYPYLPVVEDHVFCWISMEFMLHNKWLALTIYMFFCICILMTSDFIIHWHENIVLLITQIWLYNILVCGWYWLVVANISGFHSQYWFFSVTDMNLAWQISLWPMSLMANTVVPYIFTCHV